MPFDFSQREVPSESTRFSDTVELDKRCHTPNVRGPDSSALSSWFAEHIAKASASRSETVWQALPEHVVQDFDDGMEFSVGDIQYLFLTAADPTTATPLAAFALHLIGVLGEEQLLPSNALARAIEEALKRPTPVIRRYAIEAAWQARCENARVLNLIRDLTDSSQPFQLRLTAKAALQSLGRSDGE
ncbi:MAG: hypothetical protein R3F61_05830 [Myxococcota bacterium]